MLLTIKVYMYQYQRHTIIWKVFSKDFGIYIYKYTCTYKAVITGSHFESSRFVMAHALVVYNYGFF
jgi:hypothetical protein